MVNCGMAVFMGGFCLFWALHDNEKVINKGKTSKVTVTQAPKSGRAYKTTGVTLIVAGFFFQAVSIEVEGGWRMKVLVFLVGVLISSSGVFLVWRGREYVAKADGKQILTESNPCILYL